MTDFYPRSSKPFTYLLLRKALYLTTFVHGRKHQGTAREVYSYTSSHGSRTILTRWAHPKARP